MRIARTAPRISASRRPPRILRRRLPLTRAAKSPPHWENPLQSSYHQLQTRRTEISQRQALFKRFQDMPLRLGRGRNRGRDKEWDEADEALVVWRERHENLLKFIQAGLGLEGQSVDFDQLKSLAQNAADYLANTKTAFNKGSDLVALGKKEAKRKTAQIQSCQTALGEALNLDKSNIDLFLKIAKLLKAFDEQTT